MAYDERLAERVGALLAATPQLSRRAMFGGLSFLIGGHLAVVASSEGDLLARVGPGARDALLAEEGARAAEMGGRTMRGWLRVDPAAIEADAALARWVERSVRFVQTLPAKP